MHSLVRSKNVSWLRLIWPTLYCRTRPEGLLHDAERAVLAIAKCIVYLLV